MRVALAPAARRAFGKLPAESRTRLQRRIDALADDPRPHGSDKIVGEQHTYRIRVGDLRIIYEIRETEVLILVLAIGPREHVYRRR